MGAVKGIDVSYWQQSVDFKKVKAAGIKFVIIRLGYNATLNLDSTFEAKYKAAKAAGLDIGVYYYSTAMTVAQAKKEAAFCLKHLKGKKLQYPVFIDLEDNDTSGKCSKAALANIAKSFCTAIVKGGFRAGVYASYYWLTSKIGDISDLNVWVAQYNSACSYSKRNKVMWQYTSSGKVSGISGNVDMNYCYKDYGNAAATASTKKTYAGAFPKLPERGYFNIGDSGAQVRNLQRLLNWASGTGLAVDGIIGPKTIAAVKTYQKKYGLTQDGLFGRACLSKAKKIKK